MASITTVRGGPGRKSSPKRREGNLRALIDRKIARESSVTSTAIATKGRGSRSQWEHLERHDLPFATTEASENSTPWAARRASRTQLTLERLGGCHEGRGVVEPDSAKTCVRYAQSRSRSPRRKSTRPLPNRVRQKALRSGRRRIRKSHAEKSHDPFDTRRFRYPGRSGEPETRNERSRSVLRTPRIRIRGIPAGTLLERPAPDRRPRALLARRHTPENSPRPCTRNRPVHTLSHYNPRKGNNGRASARARTYAGGSGSLGGGVVGRCSNENSTFPRMSPSCRIARAPLLLPPYRSTGPPRLVRRTLRSHSGRACVPTSSGRRP